MRKMFVLIYGIPNYIGNRLSSCICFFQSLLFNLTYLPLKQAIRMPIWLERPRFRLIRLMRNNKVRIDCDKVSYKMIRMGVFYNTWNLEKGVTFQLRNNSTLIFKGKAVVGNGSTIVCYDNATIEFGNNFSCASGCKIIAKENITFGNDVLIGWNGLFMDTDFHRLTYVTGELPPPVSRPIKIGNSNWFGCNCTVLKGFQTEDSVVITAGTICTKRTDMKEKNVYGNRNTIELLAEGRYYDKNND